MGKTIAFFKKIKDYAVLHKVKSAVASVLLIGIAYWLFNLLFVSANTQTSYVMATVQKGTIVSSISGTGQVSVSDQIDLKPKASGDVVYVGAVDGQAVKAGDLIVEL